jgi:chemotaxis protein histidine kinase CheA
MMVRLLLYAYCVGRPSSRGIEKATYEDVAFRYLSANQHPDHDTLAAFRQRHWKALAQLFAQGLQLCREAGLVRIGKVALDGTKLAANASRRPSRDYAELQEREGQLEQQVGELLEQAARVDAEEDARFGKGERGEYALPKHLATAEQQLARIRQAKAVLEQAARERAEQARREREQQRAAGKPTSEAQKKRWQRAQQPVEESPARYNTTDPESQLMKAGGGFLQAYNAQAAVLENQVVVACEVTPEAVDKQQLVPMAAQVAAALGQMPPALLADAGYWSEAAITHPMLAATDLYVSPDRWPGQAPKKNAPASATAQQMRAKLQSAAGKATYRLRQQTVEPVFGQIKQARGFRRFLFRGLDKVRAEWALICLTHNLLKLYRHLLPAAGGGGRGGANFPSAGRRIGGRRPGRHAPTVRSQSTRCRHRPKG